MNEFVYKCWKCKYRRLIHQKDTAELELYCPKCGRKLFQTNLVHGLKTDTTFMIGSHADDGFGSDENARKAARRRAKELGVNISGKRFCPGLVDSEGDDMYDPKAWVSSRAEVEQRCHEKGWGCKGTINVKPRGLEEEPGAYKINPELVDEAMQDIVEEHGPLPKKEAADLREKLTKQMSGED